MAFSDARNERARAAAAMGGRSADGPPHAGRGGGAVAGMGNPGGGFSRSGPVRNVGAEMNRLNPRREFRPSPSYEGSFGNIAKALSRGIPGPGMVAGAVQDIGGFRPGFTGFTGRVQGPGSYDGRDATRGQQPGGAPPSAIWSRMFPQANANQARANALQGAAAPMSPQPWWRTPFPGAR